MWIFYVLDVITIEKTGECFRLLYDVKGRFMCHAISQDEASYKLAKVRKVAVGQHAIPYCVTHDARTIRYPDPAIQANDSVVIDLKTGKITDSIKFDTGNTVMVIGGRNTGRIGTITHRERHASKLIMCLHVHVCLSCDGRQIVYFLHMQTLYYVIIHA